ncbi:MAG: hypothetical protein AAGK02_09415, partial [Pseudomonadota bacterium]
TQDRVKEVVEALETFGAGQPLSKSSALQQLVTDHDAASEFAHGWIRSMVAAAKQAPLGEVPFRHSCSAGFSRVQLMQAGPATLSLLAYEELPSVKEPRTASFSDRETYEIVISGSATGYQYSVRNPDTANAEIVIAPTKSCAGTKVRLRPKHDARQFVHVSGMLSVLQLSRTLGEGAADTIVYSLTDASIAHRSSGDKRASQNVMALAVLGAMEHSPAISTMTELAVSPGNLEVRWEAIRQLLAIKPVEGIRVLTAIATWPSDPLSNNAARLRGQLLTAHPVLADIEEAA